MYKHKNKIFRVLPTRGVVCCDESNRHHEKRRVRFELIFKKFGRPQENRPENDSNGFGKLIACSFQEKSEKIDNGTHLTPNGQFRTRPPKNLLQLWDFGRFSSSLQRKMVEFKSCLNCWHATHIQYKAFLRRSKAFLSIRGEFGVNVPFKGAVLTGTLSAKSPLILINV